MNLYVDERRLLDVWHEVISLSRPQKEVAVLAAVTEQSPDQCARLPVGERDRRLMLLHERTFGVRYECEMRCASCGLPMAFSFANSDLRLESGEVDPEALILTEGRVVVKLHQPNSADVTACLSSANPAAALFTRCVRVQSSPAHRVGQMRAGDLPISLRQSAIERLAALDPYADLMFELECPSCDHDNKVMFDPVVALFRSAEQYLPSSLPAAPPKRTSRSNLQVQAPPGAAVADFLDRVIRRHAVDAVVHPLRS